MADIVAQEVIENKIHIIRGKKVMLDRDLAALYEVTTGNLNKAVKRNITRFPDDFMFQLTPEETKILMFQIGRSSWGGTRKPSYAFTENGVAQPGWSRWRLNEEKQDEVHPQMTGQMEKIILSK